MLIKEPQDTTIYPTACGGQLREAGDHPSVEYRGQRIWFCHRACLLVFETDPDRFMAGEIEHPLEEA